MTEALKATSHKRKRKVETDEQKSTESILTLKEAWDIIKYNFSVDNLQIIHVPTVDEWFEQENVMNL
jgi:hypothetical protein